MKSLKFIALCVATAALTACGGGGSSGGGGVNPSPTPVINATGVNIGNVSTIPLGHGGGSTSAIVSNNFPNQLLLSSATYIVYGPSGASAAKNALLPDSPVNATLCTSVQAKGTCNISLGLPQNAEQQGQYLITMNFLNSGDGKIYSTSQLISYSTAVPINSDGIQVSTINNTLFNIPGGDTTYSVPFVLTKAVSNLSAVSDHNNPAFAPSISCAGTPPYAAGTACTLFVHVSQTGNAKLISGNVTVTSNVGSSSAQVKSKLISIKGTTGYLFNVPVTVVQNNTGNLITSAINVIVNPADGTSPQTITLLNNGSGSITGITIIGNTPTVVGANTCTGTLAISGACTFTVNATLTQNAQAAVVVNYTSNNTSNSLAFNVNYIVPSSTAGMSMTPSGNLNNTVINTTNSINVTVTNTGTAALSNIIFTPTSGLATAMTYGSSSTCATNGTQALSAGQSCTLVVQYAPTVISAGPSVIIRETAQYTAPDGSIASYTAATATISYTAITGNAFVYITPNYVAYGIRADNTDTATQTFVIVNAGPISTLVNPESLANPPVTAYTSTGGLCSFPQTLGAAGSGTESCTVNARFGPTASVINTSAQMTATYTTSGATTATAFSTLRFNSSTAALVSISNISASGTTGNGQGAGTAYTFTNSPIVTAPVFTVTYQNTGTESALTFSIALNTLPAGYYKTGGTCGSGAATSTLASGGGTCTVLFSPESAALYNSYSLNGDISFNFPGWSYTDSTGLNTNTSPTFTGFTAGKVWVTANALATVTESPVPTNFTGAAAGSTGTNTLTFAGTPNGTVVNILNASNFSPSITFTGNPCTVSGGTCSIVVNNLSNLPVTTYYFFYVVSPAGGSPTVGIIKSGSFAYTN